MLKVLINAYACSPHTGSEPGMAWNWCVNLAKYCELHIITEGEFKNHIDEALATLPQGKNMHFYYQPVSEEVRRMCWNQGDWRFYKHYEKWQYATYEMAKKIIAHENIDIIHQLNMIGFREPGYLWKIKDIPFVWGPIGGMFFFPINYLDGVSFNKKAFIYIKNFINKFQIKHSRRVKLALLNAKYILASTPNEVECLSKYHNIESIMISETGCFVNNKIITKPVTNNCFNILWVGRFIFSKQLSIALRSIALNKHLPNIKFHIVGTGNENEVIYYKQLSADLCLEGIVTWHNHIPNNQVIELMRESNLFFFTSVAEATSTVVLEAISNKLPVLCFNTCGFGAIIDDKVGVKIPLSNPEQSVIDFAEKINYLYNHRKLLKQMSENCVERQQELSWERKVQKMVDLYKKILKN